MFDIAETRAQFPIFKRPVYDRTLVYFDNAATSQKPAMVLDRIAEYYRASNGNIHRASHFLGEKASSAYESAREAVQRFINAGHPHEIVFTHGTTESLNLVADAFGGWYIKPGDEVLITEMEHHSNLVPWQMLCRKKEASLKALPFGDDGSLLLDRIESALSPRTRLVALSHVSNVLGSLNPIREITAVAHARGIPVVIDGAQAIQHLPVDVREIGCDFYAFSGHKMYAETGIGVLYGKEEWLKQMPPYQYGGGMISSVQLEKTSFTEPPLKFEAGTPNIAGAISLQAAIEFIEQTGMPRVAAHEHDLLHYAHARLSEIEHLRIYGGAEPRAGVLSFNLERISPYDISMILDKMGIAVRAGTHCAEPVMHHYGVPGMVRASFGIYNSREEIDMLIEGLHRAQEMLG